MNRFSFWTSLTTANFFAPSAADQLFNRHKVAFKRGESAESGLVTSFVCGTVWRDQGSSMIGKDGFGTTVVDI